MLAAAFDDLALVVDEKQIGYPDVAEVHGEGIDPEVVAELGVAGRDVSRHALVEAEASEEPEGSRQPLLPVQPLLFDRLERGGKESGRVGHTDESRRPVKVS